MAPSMDKDMIEYTEDRPDSLHASKPHQVVEIEGFRVLGLNTEDAEFYINYPAEKRKKVVHKVWLAV